MGCELCSRWTCTAGCGCELCSWWKAVGRVCWAEHTPVPWPGSSAPGMSIIGHGQECPQQAVHHSPSQTGSTNSKVLIHALLLGSPGHTAVTCKAGGVQRHGAAWKKPDRKSTPCGIPSPEGQNQASCSALTKLEAAVPLGHRACSVL